MKSNILKLPWFDRRQIDEEPDIDEKELPPPYEETEQSDPISPSGDRKPAPTYDNAGPRGTHDSTEKVSVEGKGKGPSVKTTTRTEMTWRFNDFGTITKEYNVPESVEISGKTRLCAKIVVGYFAWLRDDARIDGDIQAQCVNAIGNVRISSNLKTEGQIWLKGNVESSGEITTESHAYFADRCRVSGRVTAKGNLEVSGNATLTGEVIIGGDVTVKNSAKITGKLTVGGKLLIWGEEAFVAEHTHAGQKGWKGKGKCKHTVVLIACEKTSE